MDSVWFKPHWILVDFLDDELAHEKIAELVKGSHYSLDIAGYMVKNEQKKIYGDSARTFFTDKENIERMFR
ncbi:MAG: hypothetical protein IJM92_12505 [Fibrobacter sp.]|uniref:hypothetical protein n=1 Tax=Fibrobacter sp. TaxID=35828 RepID=UPI0025C07C74|nr:hypothetical protein [Fibrobacter sp.]MBQ7080448.1 hypothetical protein [Fibrobacter sp.]